MTLQIRIINL